MPAWAQSVALIDGANDPVDVTRGERQLRYYRLLPDDHRILVRAEGPVVISLRLRALSSGTERGVFRVVRDGEGASSNPYSLAPDPDGLSAVPESVSRGFEPLPLTEERQFHIDVPEGEHEYALSITGGAPVILRVLRARQWDSKLALLPEAPLPKASIEQSAEEAGADSAAESDEVLTSSRIEEFDSDEAAPETAQVDGSAASKEADETTERVRNDPRYIAGIEVASVPTRDAPPIHPLDATELPLREGPPPRLRGPALALRAGALGFAGYPDGATPPSGASFSWERRVTFPVALEVAWDFSPVWSLFLEGGYHQLSSPASSVVSDSVKRTRMQFAPVSAGVTWARQFGSVVGVRLRLGATGAWVKSSTFSESDGPERLSQSAVGLGGVAGLGLELKAGPGRVSIEARYQLLRVESALSDLLFESPLESSRGELGGALVLAGYRFEM